MMLVYRSTFVLLLLGVAAGHQPIFEKEVETCAMQEAGCEGAILPANGEGDTSFENPKAQLYEAIGYPPYEDYNLYGAPNSQAIFGYLNGPEDFDVYSYEITQQDIDVYTSIMGFTPITYSVLPQACLNNADTYFSYALVADPFILFDPQTQAPIGPTPIETLPPRLADAVVQNGFQGKTVLYVKDEAPPPGGERSVYEIPELEIGWFLPLGCESPSFDEVNCDPDSRSIFVSAIAPGSVDLLVFYEGDDGEGAEVSLAATDTMGYDYTINFGLGEMFVTNTEVITLTEGQRHLVNGCQLEDGTTDGLGDESDGTSDDAGDSSGSSNHMVGWVLRVFAIAGAAVQLM